MGVDPDLATIGKDWEGVRFGRELEEGPDIVDDPDRRDVVDTLERRFGRVFMGVCTAEASILARTLGCSALLMGVIGDETEENWIDSC